MRKTFVNLERQIREKKAKGEQRTLNFPPWAAKTFKILCILFVVVLVNFVSFKIFGTPQPQEARIDKVSGDNAAKAIEMSRKVFESYKDNSGNEFPKLIARMDSHAVKDCKTYMEKLEIADFNRASVFSPAKDSEQFYVYVPARNGEKVQFVFRNLNSNLALDWVCLNRK